MTIKQDRELPKNKAGADQSKPATQKTKLLNITMNRQQPIVSKPLIDVSKITFCFGNDYQVISPVTRVLELKAKGLDIASIPLDEKNDDVTVHDVAKYVLRYSKPTGSGVTKMTFACNDCPKYQRCNANICPLDTEWPKRKHIAGESVCFYLLEAQKVDAEAIFSTTHREYLYSAMVEATQAIKCCYVDIKTRLERASKTASRMEKPVKQEVAT